MTDFLWSIQRDEDAEEFGRKFTRHGVGGFLFCPEMWGLSSLVGSISAEKKLNLIATILGCTRSREYAN